MGERVLDGAPVLKSELATGGRDPPLGLGTLGSGGGGSRLAAEGVVFVADVAAGR